jgi:hypothetical protein
MNWLSRLPLVIPLVVLSCDLTEPDRRFDASVPGIRLDDLPLTEFAPGQHVAGAITLAFDVPATSRLWQLRSGRHVVRNVTAVYWYVDDTLLGGTSTPPFTFALDTTQWPGGEHEISAAVFDDTQSGLGRYVGLPAAVYVTTLVFDQTPPTPVAVQSLDWEGTSPRITWSQNQDPNFHAYVISRRSVGLYRVHEDIVIFDRSVTTCLDTAVVQTIGGLTHYQVNTWNRVAYSAADTASINWGVRVPVSWYRDDRPIVNRVGAEELYVLHRDDGLAGLPNRLSAVSKATNTIVRSIDVQSANHLASSVDGTLLYVDEAGVNFLVVDAQTFTVQRTLMPPFAFDAVVGGRPNRFYAWSQTTFGVFDDTSGARIAHFEVPYMQGYWTDLCISQDGNVVYAAHGNMLYRINVNTDLLVVPLQRPIAMSNFGNLQVSSDGSTLYVLHGPPFNYLEILDTANFALKSRLDPPLGSQDDWLEDAIVTSDRIYVSVTREDPHVWYTKPGTVLEYDLLTQTVARSWNFIVVSQGMVASRDETSLYAGPWVVTVK